MPKTKPVRTRVSTVTCKGCGEEIYSRARHDYRTCKCGKTSIDGGRSYVKIGFDDKVGFTQRTRYVPFTRDQLFQDWNQSLNRCGKIGKTEENEYGRHAITAG